jgi:hypothetical protein
MHLRIRKIREQWSCAEVYSSRPIGEGVVEVEITCRLHWMHPNMVLGLFLYDENKPAPHDEVDIELSQWEVRVAKMVNMWCIWKIG